MLAILIDSTGKELRVRRREIVQQLQTQSQGRQEEKHHHAKQGIQCERMGWCLIGLNKSSHRMMDEQKIDN